MQATWTLSTVLSITVWPLQVPIVTYGDDVKISHDWHNKRGVELFRLFVVRRGLTQSRPSSTGRTDDPARRNQLSSNWSSHPPSLTFFSLSFLLLIISYLFKIHENKTHEQWRQLSIRFPLKDCLYLQGSAGSLRCPFLIDQNEKKNNNRLAWKRNRNHVT
jgi:hypothetical protein